MLPLLFFLYSNNPLWIDAILTPLVGFIALLLSEILLTYAF